jgi:hypothetical protein
MAEAARQSETPLPNKPTDEAVVAVNLSKIKAAQEVALSGHGSLRSVLAHAEGKGVHLKAAKRALAIVKSGDADAWLEETRETTRYLKILRHGIQENQLSLFEFEPSLAPLDEKAGLDGRACGLDGGEESANPHDLNTGAGQAWIAAYRQGLFERELVLSMKDDESDEVTEEDEAFE